LILVIDLTAYPVKWIGIDQPAIGWFVLGLLVGGFVGLIQSLKYIKQYSYLNKAYQMAIGIALVLILAFVTSLSFKSNIDPFSQILLQEEFLPALNSSWDYIGSAKAAIRDGALFHQDEGIYLWADQNTNQNQSINDGNYYYFLINGNGEFAMGKHSENQKQVDKVGWQQSITINRGNSRNRLKIVCYQQKIIGWINDQRVGMFEDKSFTSGQIGVISETGNGPPISVYFDSIVVKENPD
jgi:hypothetical protein